MQIDGLIGLGYTNILEYGINEMSSSFPIVHLNRDLAQMYDSCCSWTKEKENAEEDGEKTFVHEGVNIYGDVKTLTGIDTFRNDCRARNCIDKSQIPAYSVTHSLIREAKRRK